MPRTILIVYDHSSPQQMTEHAIGQKLGYQAITIDDGEKAIHWIQSGKQPQPDLMLLDLVMPDKGGLLGDGLRLIREIKAHKPQLPILVLTHYGDDAHAAQAMEAGANDFLTKPVSMERLKLSIQCAMKIQHMSNTIAYLERKTNAHMCFSDIVGRSAHIKAALALAEKASTSKMPVWIEGESGTGKELFARAIHGGSDRVGKPFVVVDCERLPEETAEAMLFGQEKMPGKVHFILGRWREADQGTLYFREIGALKPALQQRLLEVLEEGAVTPLGASCAIPANVRIICGTTKNMESGIREGTFSHLLYKLLKGTSIALPALRDRLTDIAPLADHFLALYSAMENKYISGLSGEAMQVLENQPWPGNVRQMANFVWRAALLCTHDHLDAGTVRLIQQLEPVHYVNRSNLLSDAPDLLDMQGHLKKLKSIEDEVIRFALRQSGGCMTQAARSLGIGRSTLYRRINEMSPAPGDHISRANQTTRPMIHISSTKRS